MRAIQAGAVAVVLVAMPFAAFDLDRFFVPKELVLHLAALIAAATCGAALVRGAGGEVRRRVDIFLGLYLLLCAVSVLFATNRWLGLRALAISASSIVLFWIARSLAHRGMQRPLLIGIALAVIVAAATALLQAYGVRLDIFASSRAPGGTLGNRNFVAHVCALGLPLLFAVPKRIAIPGVAIASAALVLTRSRAAWLACAAMLVVYVGAVILMRQWTSFRRFLMMLVAAGAGVAAALLLPNALHWRSDNPYLQSVQDVANYQEGSGRGRLVQYERSLLLALRHPLFGVGPGNWAVEYPARVPRSDPSLNPSEGGMTYNPWPSSDWIAFIAERGVAATVLLLLAFVATLRKDPVLLAMMAAVVVEGMFDAVLLLAVPAFLVWTALGALSAEPVVEAAPAKWPLSFVAAIIVSLFGAMYSAAQLIAMEMYVSGGRATLERAARFDPGNYRIQLRLARGGRRRCAHALAAHALYPHADEAATLSRGCR